MEDVLAANHGHDVGGIEDEFLVDGVGAGINPGVGIVGANWMAGSHRPWQTASRASGIALARAGSAKKLN